MVASDVRLVPTRALFLVRDTSVLHERPRRCLIQTGEWIHCTGCVFGEGVLGVAIASSTPQIEQRRDGRTRWLPTGIDGGRELSTSSQKLQRILQRHPFRLPLSNTTAPSHHHYWGTPRIPCAPQACDKYNDSHALMMSKFGPRGVSRIPSDVGSFHVLD